MEMLRAAYQDIVPLQAWLSRMLGAARDSQTAELLLQHDPHSYRHMLESVFVGASEDVKTPSFTSSQHSSLKEVVLRAIERCLKKKSPIPNVLCLGYCLRCTDAGAHTGPGDEELVYPNSCVNTILSKPWHTLHNRVGDTIMLFILQYTSLFLEVAPTCFVQLTGVPVYSLLSDKTLPRSRCTSTTPGQNRQKNSLAVQNGPQLTKHCNARLRKKKGLAAHNGPRPSQHCNAGLSEKQSLAAQNGPEPSQHCDTGLRKSNRMQKTLIRQPQIEEYGRCIRKQKYEKVDEEKYEELRKQAEMYSKQRRDTSESEEVDKLITTDISETTVPMVLIGEGTGLEEGTDMLSKARNRFVETVVSPTDSTAQCEVSRKRKLLVSGSNFSSTPTNCNSPDRIGTVIHQPAMKRQKVCLNQSMSSQKNLSDICVAACQIDSTTKYLGSKKRKLSDDCSDRTEGTNEGVKRQKICSADQPMSLPSTTSSANDNMNANNVYYEVDSNANCANQTKDQPIRIDLKTFGTNLTTFETKRLSSDHKTIEAEQKNKSLSSDSDADRWASLPNTKISVGDAEMQLGDKLPKYDVSDDTKTAAGDAEKELDSKVAKHDGCDQSSSSGQAGLCVGKSQGDDRLCIEKDALSDSPGSSKLSQMKRTQFKPFDSGLILPRHTYMYRKHPRETLARNDLLYRLTLDAESLAALYQDIFVDTKVLKSSGETIHVEQPSMEEWSTFLDHRKLAKCATKETSQTSTLPDNSPGANIETSCSDNVVRSAEAVDSPRGNTISQQHSSFGHDTYLLRSDSSDRSRSMTHTGRNDANCSPDTGTGQNSAEYRDSILKQHSSFGHHTHLLSSNKCNSMPEIGTHNSAAACLSNGRVEQDSEESKDLFVCQSGSPTNTCLKEQFESTGGVVQTDRWPIAKLCLTPIGVRHSFALGHQDDGAKNARQTGNTDKEALLKQRKALLLWCQTGDCRMLPHLNSDVRVDSKCLLQPKLEAAVDSTASTICDNDDMHNVTLKLKNREQHAVFNCSRPITQPEIPIDDSVTVEHDQKMAQPGACVKSVQAVAGVLCNENLTENTGDGTPFELQTCKDDETKAGIEVENNTGETETDIHMTQVNKVCNKDTSQIGIRVEIDTNKTEGHTNKSHSDKICMDGLTEDSQGIEMGIKTDDLDTSEMEPVAEECVTAGCDGEETSRQLGRATDYVKADVADEVQQPRRSGSVGEETRGRQLDGATDNVKTDTADEMQEPERDRIPVARDVMSLLADFVENHRKCPYKSLLKQLCPVNVVRRTDLPVLLHKHTPPRKVFLFLRRCLLKTVPQQLFGTAANRNVILKSVWKMLSAGRYDKLCLGQLMAGLKTSVLPWLPCHHGNSTRLHLLARLVCWMFTRYMFGVVRAFFYVTDTTFLKYRLLYYRQAVWVRVQQHGIDGLTRSKTLKPLSEEDVVQLVMSEQSLGVSALRFLPKEKSLRPIVNMGYMDTQAADKNMSINKQLFSLHQVLSYLKEQNPALLGHGKLGTDDIYQAWLLLIDKWRHLGRPKLYFVKTDISRCYDSIIQEKLYHVLDGILQKALSDDEVIVRKYMMTHVSRGAVKTRFIRQVDALSEFDGDFVCFARHLVEQKHLQHVILMDKVVYEHETLDSLLEKLQKHLFNNVVKIGSQYYLQQCGISQGAVISTLLCSFYYAHMEHSVLHVDPDDFLLRIVDDYLFISPAKERAEGFLQQMAAGFPQYNCHTNVDKILTNFPCAGFSSAAADWFPWCGMLFNTRTLEISVDYSRLRGIRIDDTITFDLCSHPGTVLQKKILFSAAQKCHPIYLDGRVNSRGQILTNLHRVCLLAAFKLHAYIRQLPHTHRTDNNTTFFIGVIQSVGSLVWWHYNKTQNASPHVEDSPLCKDSIMWVCLEACLQKLGSHPSQYSTLLKRLRRKKRLLERKLGRDRVGSLRECIEPELPEDFQLML